MTDDEKTDGVAQMIRVLASMKAYEIVKAAESLGVLRNLLAAEKTICALADQVKLRNKAPVGGDATKVPGGQDAAELLKGHEDLARTLSTAWVAYSLGITFDNATGYQRAASVGRFWYELAETVEKAMAAPQ